MYTGISIVSFYPLIPPPPRAMKFFLQIYPLKLTSNNYPTRIL